MTWCWWLLQLSAFMTGPPQRPLSKDAFYAKLKGTPVAQLPRVKQLVEVLFEEGLVKWDGTPIEVRISTTIPGC